MYQLINYTIPLILGFILGIIFLLVFLTLIIKARMYGIEFLYNFWFDDNDD